MDTLAILIFVMTLYFAGEFIRAIPYFVTYTYESIKSYARNRKTWGKFLCTVAICKTKHGLINAVIASSDNPKTLNKLDKHSAGSGFLMGDFYTKDAFFKDLDELCSFIQNYIEKNKIVFPTNCSIQSDDVSDWDEISTKTTYQINFMYDAIVITYVDDNIRKTQVLPNNLEALLKLVKTFKMDESSKSKRVGFN